MSVKELSMEILNHNHSTFFSSKYICDIHMDHDVKLYKDIPIFPNNLNVLLLCYFSSIL